MALPTPTTSGFQQIPNNGFESGAVDWTTTGTANIVNESQLSGSWCVKVSASGEGNDGGVAMEDGFPVVPGQSITVTATGQMTAGTPGTSFAVAIQWYTQAGTLISASVGPQINRASIGGSVGSASVTGIAPAGAAVGRAAGYMNVAAGGTTNTIYMDNFSWNYNFPVVATLTQPGPDFTEADQIPFRVNVTGLPSGVTVASVAYYYMTWDGSDYIDATLLSTETSSPFAFNAPAMSDGQYGGYALITLSSGLVITTNSRVFVVGEAPAPDTREFKASNAYTFLVGENFTGMGSSIPSTALVIGAEVIIDYELEVLTRALDLGVSDPTAATPSVLFDIVNSGTIQAVLLDKNGSTYSVNGAPMTASVPVLQADFTLDEEGTSEGKKWAVYTMDTPASVTVGDDNLLFGQGGIDAPSFLNKALGIRFVPTLGTKPAYADSGESCIRFKINALKFRVYFDAGSIDYYFDTGDGILKAQLASSYVTSGNLTTGDAAGYMQLLPEFELMEGTGDTITAGSTIHSAYPTSSENQIGIVPYDDMWYNSLPDYNWVEDARSRYVFITANFYGDPMLDSIYGANGVDRAFSYNGDYFYKIYTQAEEVKDKPRHVAFHHSHLALGYGEGRVDLSVVGEPYNFSGLDGASSWAIGDKVTGLLPLSGAMLGIFCGKSVVGLSGTTVDNFATQTISAKLGAVEYTVTDMGFPVYANSYGIYTLEQTQQYGDFLGSPMSQQVSPWLRPRLIRRATSDREVVVAWPVRSKNQYKLAFSDGYVLTMTMNYGGQTAPTFSKQKYFISPDALDVDLFTYPSIVPAAISSELDESGEERIHIANKVVTTPEPTPPVTTTINVSTYFTAGAVDPSPPDWNYGAGSALTGLYIPDLDTTYWYEWDALNLWYYVVDETPPVGDYSGCTFYYGDTGNEFDKSIDDVMVISYA